MAGSWKIALLVLSGAIAFAAFVWMQSRESRSPETIREETGGPSADLGDSQSRKDSTRETGAATVVKRTSGGPGYRSATGRSRVSGRPPEGATSPGSEGERDRPKGALPSLAARMGVLLGRAAPDPVDSGASFVASPEATPQPAPDGEIGASADDPGEEQSCRSPRIRKAVFDLDNQPEMRGVFDAAMRLARAGVPGAEVFSQRGSPAYLLTASEPRAFETGAIFDDRLLVIVRGQCVKDVQTMKSELAP